jgi:P27 family predicted phage terminase small subunit
MSGGRRKEPVDLLVLKGKAKLTKAEIEKRKKEEVQVRSDKVFAPEYLPEVLHQEFYDLAEQLLEVNILGNLDVDTLAKYISLRKTHNQLMNQLLILDPLSEDYATTLRKQDLLFKQTRALANDLGLSITARCKITVPTQKDKEEPSKEEKRFGNMI